jgi:hypothetical protein
MKRTLLAAVALFLATTYALMASTPALVLDFSAPKPAWSIMPAEKNTADYEIVSGELRVRSENFWSAYLQAQTVNFDLRTIPDNARLEIELTSTIYDREPSIRVLMFDESWANRVEFIVPINIATQKRATTYLSAQTLAEARAKAGDQALQSTDRACNVFINFVATSGNSPWDVSIKRISFVTPKQ